MTKQKYDTWEVLRKQIITNYFKTCIIVYVFKSLKLFTLFAISSMHSIDEMRKALTNHESAISLGF